MSTIKRGDTLLEVVFAFVMFSLVTVITVAAMSGGISQAEASLELTLARTEIDTQSDTLRYIHGAFANDRAYDRLWHKITDRAVSDSNVIPELSISDCSELYDDLSPSADIYSAKAFVINSRIIGNNDDDSQPDFFGNTLITANGKDSDTIPFIAAPLYPRLIYTESRPNRAINDSDIEEESLLQDELNRYVARAEGIYDFVVPDKGHTVPYYYDFHIYTCWYAPGSKRPTTIGTVTRLYNPEFSD